MRRLLFAVLLCGVRASAQPASDTPAQPLNIPPMPAASAPQFGEQPPLRVLEAYHEGGGTRLIIQSREPLVTGRSLYVGSREEAVTVGQLFSRGGGLHYYFASAPRKLDVATGDSVRYEPTKRPALPAAILRSLRASHGFEQKSVAELTAVQGDRAMIDKGTLHEVHERDLFRIYDATGTLKGLLEVRGIGDLQSSGLLYRSGRDKSPVEARPGDYAVFLGQRRLFGLGVIGGVGQQRRRLLYRYDESKGVGLLWSMTFHNGYGLEAIFGYYSRSGKDVSSENPSAGPERYEINDSRSAKFILPISVKKNFFYPSLISPFVAAGPYWFDGEHAQEVLLTAARSSAGRQVQVKHGVYPQFAAGLEFFPARFFRPRVEVRHFFGPSLTANGSRFQTDTTFYSIGVLTSW